jgi:hypothetical protein
MTLIAFDDFPFHQHPMPFTTSATTDARFNDGYFLAFYGPRLVLLHCHPLHPNVNVIDGGASVAHAERQRAVRASRALRPRFDEIDVGPIRLDIVDPMRRVRLRVEDDAARFGFDVEIETVSRPIVEDRYQHAKHGVVVNDTIRYTTVCRATGTAHVDGERLSIDRWHAMRDHSWGMRASMGVPVRVSGTDRSEADADRRALRLWVPFEAGDHCGFFNTHEDAAGNPIDFEGRLDFHSGGSLDLVAVEHDLTYVPGDRSVAGGRSCSSGADGSRRHYAWRRAGRPPTSTPSGTTAAGTTVSAPGISRGSRRSSSATTTTSRPGAETSGPPHVPCDAGSVRPSTR